MIRRKSPREGATGHVTLVLIIAAGVLVTLASHSWSDASQSWMGPADVYEAACAACHGTDGTGMSAEVVGFETELPDFTDCSFQTREPDGDWFAVAHDGGPVRGFSHHMPAFGEALTDGEIEMAVEHVRTFCEEEGWPSGDLNLPRPMFTEKAYVEDEAVFTFAMVTEEPYSILGEIVFEKRFATRSQLEVVVPFGAAQIPGNGDKLSWSGGLGDLALGIKHVFVAKKKSGTIFSGIGEIVLPTGARGVGSGKTKFEPSLAFGQILGPAGFLHLQAGMEIPIEPGATLEAF